MSNDFSDQVDTELLPEGGSLPLVIRPAVPRLSLASWAEEYRDQVMARLRRHGGILFRGFDLKTAEEFESTARKLSGDLLEYRERSSPRNRVSGSIYTSTEYPPDQPIFLHNENSYQHAWPMLIYFFCHTPPTRGGETPIADTRRVFAQIDAEIRDRFVAKKWMYVRNFGSGFGLSWQTVFQTEEKAKIAEYCHENRIQYEWLGGDQLRTRAVRPVAARHPVTGEDVWFNHATFFHISTLTDDVRDALCDIFDEEDLPANTYYGDGTPIEPEVMAHLRTAYEAEMVTFPWQKGDFLMLDNMLVAHARSPFQGERKILVGMADPCSWDNLGSART